MNRTICTRCERAEGSWEHNRTNPAHHDFTTEEPFKTIGDEELPPSSELLCLDCGKNTREGRHRGKGAHRFVRSWEQKPKKSRAKKNATPAKVTSKAKGIKIEKEETEPLAPSFALNDLDDAIEIQETEVWNHRSALAVEEAKLEAFQKAREIVATVLGASA